MKNSYNMKNKKKRIIIISQNDYIKQNFIKKMLIHNFQISNKKNNKNSDTNINYFYNQQNFDLKFKELCESYQSSQITPNELISNIS